MSRTRKDRKQDYRNFSDASWYLYKQFHGNGPKPFCRDWWGQQRRIVRDDLRAGREPAPTRTRSSVKWELS